jgi:hypothetical protein
MTGLSGQKTVNNLAIKLTQKQRKSYARADGWLTMGQSSRGAEYFNVCE